MSSFWWNFHHWLHWKLSKWQLPVQPVMKISSKWRHFRFSGKWWHLDRTLSHWFQGDYTRSQLCKENKLIVCQRKWDGNPMPCSNYDWFASQILRIPLQPNKNNIIEIMEIKPPMMSLHWNEWNTHAKLTHLPLVPHICVSELCHHRFR